MKHQLPPAQPNSPPSNPEEPKSQASNPVPTPQTSSTLADSAQNVPSQGSSSKLGLVIALLALSALAVGGIFVWLGMRNLSAVEEHGRAASLPSASSSQKLGEFSAPSASRIQSVPEQLLKPEEVLSEAEAMRGPLFGKGYVQTGNDSISVLDAVAMLRRGRTEIEVAFFGALLSEAEKVNLQNMETFATSLTPAPLLHIKLALSPFGSDCSLVNVKTYEIASGTRKLSKAATDPGASELRKISCQRKKGELIELQAEGAFPAEGVKGNPAGSESKWSVEARVPLN